MDVRRMEADGEWGVLIRHHQRRCDGEEVERCRVEWLRAVVTRIKQEWREAKRAGDEEGVRKAKGGWEQARAIAADLMDSGKEWKLWTPGGYQSRKGDEPWWRLLAYEADGYQLGDEHQLGVKVAGCLVPVRQGPEVHREYALAVGRAVRKRYGSYRWRRDQWLRHEISAPLCLAGPGVDIIALSRGRYGSMGRELYRARLPERCFRAGSLYPSEETVERGMDNAQRSWEQMFRTDILEPLLIRLCLRARIDPSKASHEPTAPSPPASPRKPSHTLSGALRRSLSPDSPDAPTQITPHDPA